MHVTTISRPAITSVLRGGRVRGVLPVFAHGKVSISMRGTVSRGAAVLI